MDNNPISRCSALIAALDLYTPPRKCIYKEHKFLAMEAYEYDTHIYKKPPPGHYKGRRHGESWLSVIRPPLRQQSLSLYKGVVIIQPIDV